MLSPYAGLDSPISLQSWNHQLKVDSVDDKRIKQFADFLTRNGDFYPEVGASCENPDFMASPLVAGDASTPIGPSDMPTTPDAGAGTETAPARPALPERETPDRARPTPRGLLRPALMAVIAVALVLLGGGLAVAFGIGRGRRTPTADSVDAGFSRDMSRHHLQGVLMANLAPDRSEDPEVRPAGVRHRRDPDQPGRPDAGLAVPVGLPPSGGETMAWMGEAGTRPLDGRGRQRPHARDGHRGRAGQPAEPRAPRSTSSSCG